MIELCNPFQTELAGFDLANYDCVILSCGFERRSVALVTNSKSNKSSICCFGFNNRAKLSFLDNVKTYRDYAIEPQILSDQQFDIHIRSQIEAFTEKNNKARIAVDISCLNRYRIASVIDAWHRTARKSDVELTICYVVAKPGSRPHEVPLSSIGFVHPYFAGWTSNPEKPVHTIVSVGYEDEKVLAAMEKLEAESFTLYRTAPDNFGYFDQVTDANNALWQKIPLASVLEYDVTRPVDLFLALESFAYSALNRYRLVILPFGPKIFASVALLVAIEHAPAISVWNCSGGALEEPIQREPLGTVLGYSVKLIRD